MASYGRPDSEWDELTDAGREFLIEVARRRAFTTYTDLNTALVQRTGCRPFDFAGPGGRAAIGHLLGLIVTRDQDLDPQDPPVMLSALVIYQGGNDAGTGFYQLAKELGLLSMGASKDERDVFWTEQVKRLQKIHAG
ncbi:hypothetical protein [Streptomyces odontomachi]|uniref:hypothetical protein n=1 Tax=Streptomyces odontomachi TaxID=2944940 RepID=UPI00210A60B2|nr:hypothetical protein [Streptomyces sp. ODS25]